MRPCRVIIWPSFFWKYGREDHDRDLATLKTVPADKEGGAEESAALAAVSMMNILEMAQEASRLASSKNATGLLRISMSNLYN